MPTKPRPRAPKVSPLAYEDRLDARPLSQVDLVVIHCTELPDLAIAREYGERVLHIGSGTGNSGHYYVDRNGDCHRFVAPDRVAHHVRGYNPRSIRSEEHTSELQSLMRISYAVFCLKKKKTNNSKTNKKQLRYIRKNKTIPTHK